MATNRSRRARASRRRKKRMDRADNDLSEQEWSAIKSAWDGCCAYCGTPDDAVQKDCLLALSRGGRYTLDNIVPACRSCNASKCNDEVTGWLRRKKLDEKAFLVRHYQVRLQLEEQFRDSVPPVMPESTASSTL